MVELSRRKLKGSLSEQLKQVSGDKSFAGKFKGSAVAAVQDLLTNGLAGPAAGGTPQQVLQRELDRQAAIDAERGQIAGAAERGRVNAGDRQLAGAEGDALKSIALDRLTETQKRGGVPFTERMVRYGERSAASVIQSPEGFLSSTMSVVRHEMRKAGLTEEYRQELRQMHVEMMDAFDRLTKATESNRTVNVVPPANTRPSAPRSDALSY